MIESLILAIILIGIAILGFAVKMLFKPRYTFTKTCGSSFDPKTGKAMPCTCSSKKDDECENVKLEVKLD